MNEYLCLDCERTFDEPMRRGALSYVSGIGIMSEHWDECPWCGSENISEAHACENPDCCNAAIKDEELCESCQRAFERKFVAFMDALTPAERKYLNQITESEYLDDVADKLRKCGE